MELAKDKTDELVEKNSRLVWSIARRYARRGVDIEDLFQLGCIGLIKAIRGFDESLGNKFSTYAVPKIAGEMRRFLRDDGSIKVSRSVKEMGFKLYAARERLRGELNREPHLSELSEATGIEPCDIVTADIAVCAVDSFERDMGDGQKLGDTLGNSGIEEQIIDSVAVRSAVKKLPERERKVIYLRFFKSLTQDKTAAILGISQVQVSRIERSALARLRESVNA